MRELNAGRRGQDFLCQELLAVNIPWEFGTFTRPQAFPRTCYRDNIRVPVSPPVLRVLLWPRAKSLEHSTQKLRAVSKVAV